MLAQTFLRALAPFTFAALAFAVDHPWSDTCENYQSELTRRDTTSVGAGASVGADVSLPSVGLSLGNITTKIGNINLTVTNVTIAVGNIDIQNIEIGNITVIVSVPLPGASPVNAFSAYTPARSIATSTSGPTSTVSGATTVSQTATATHAPRAEEAAPAPPTTINLATASTTSTPSGTGTSVSGSVSATASIGGGPVNLGAGNVYTEIGNVSIVIGHVNVSIGDVKIKNVTLGNIFVLVQVGQPDLAGITSNVTRGIDNAIGGAQP